MARTMLASANMPLYMWTEALRTAVLIRNRIPLARFQDKTPYKIWTGRKPDVSMLRIFGSKAYKLIDTNRPKFSKKSVSTILVGYEPG